MMLEKRTGMGKQKMLESILQRDCKKVIKIKLLVVMLFALKGCLSGMFQRELGSFFWIFYSFINGAREFPIPFVGLALSVYFLILFTISYFFIMKVGSVMILQYTKRIGIPDRFIPYFDLSWLWLAGCADLFFDGLFHLVRAIAADAPGLRLRVIMLTVFMVFNLLLNYFVYPRVSPREQNTYALASLVNSRIDALLRRFFGGKGKKNVSDMEVCESELDSKK